VGRPAVFIATTALREENKMRRIAILSAAGVFTVLAPSAQADVLTQIQGAWAIQDMSCTDVFRTDQGKITLRKRQDDTLPGFIVDGKAIHGVAAACNIASSKENVGGISLLLSCESQISFATMKVTLKIPDPNTLIQSDPEFPEVTTIYHRCN
jgi:hypothetical protein